MSVAVAGTAEIARQADNPDTLRGLIRLFVRYRSPQILLSATASSWAVRLWLGDWSRWDAVVIAAMIVFWPIQEWLIHVFILHFRPRQVFGRTIDFLSAREHRKHHGDPWRLELVFIPTPIVWGAVPFELILWNLVMPSTPLAFTAIAFYFTMSVHYEWVHYMVHTRYQPRSWYYKRLWRNHRLHHCKNENYWYGVTMLEGDWLFRTRPDYRSVAISPTCRTLGHEKDLGVGS